MSIPYSWGDQHFSFEEYELAREWNGRPLNVYTSQQMRENFSGTAPHQQQAREQAWQLVALWREAYPSHPATKTCEAKVQEMHHRQTGLRATW